MKYLLLLLLFLLCLASPVMAARYTVSSAYEDLPETVSSCPDRVGIWALPLWLFLTEFLLLNPFLALLLKGMVSLGYRRVSRDSLLDSACRRDIFLLIEDQPGIHLRGIAASLGMELGTVRHHLDQLVRYRLVSKVHSGGFARYYLPGYSPEQKQFYSLTASPSRKEIIRLLNGSPGLTRSEIGNHLMISAQAAGWHLSRLADDGIVIPAREGRSVRYSLAPCLNAVIG
jgi:predicted transcriptional regulator